MRMEALTLNERETRLDIGKKTSREGKRGLAFFGCLDKALEN